MHPLASIPSPPYGVVHLGPIPLRAYALMIILGVAVAVWLGERRWVTRGGTPGTVVDIAVWAVPFGLVGARIYHVITDHQRYFGEGQHPIDALKVWTGGLGIWGGVALGTLGAYIGCRRRGISLRAFADATAPGIALAQAIGRWGNWFNQELYGRPLHTFWALSIDRDHRPLLPDGTRDPRYADIATYHPTFLYESLWCVGVAVLVIWAEKRFRLAYGRTFALYVAAYTVGRAWIESLRVDAAHHVLGLRLNDWTSLIVFLAAAGYLYVYRDRTEVAPSAFGAEAAGVATADPETPAQAASTLEPADEAAEAPEPDEPAGDEAADAPGSGEPAGEAADAPGSGEPAGEAAAGPEPDQETVGEAPDGGTADGTGDAEQAADAPEAADEAAPDGETADEAIAGATGDEPADTGPAGDARAAAEGAEAADTPDGEPSDGRAPEVNGSRTGDEETAEADPAEEHGDTATSGEPTSPRSG